MRAHTILHKPPQNRHKQSEVGGYLWEVPWWPCCTWQLPPRPSEHCTDLPTWQWRGEPGVIIYTSHNHTHNVLWPLMHSSPTPTHHQLPGLAAPPTSPAHPGLAAPPTPPAYPSLTAPPTPPAYPSLTGDPLHTPPPPLTPTPPAHPAPPPLHHQLTPASLALCR